MDALLAHNLSSHLIDIPPSGTRAPNERWHKLAHGNLSPTFRVIDVWVDGSEVPDLHRSDWEQDPIGALHFGFEKYAGPDATIWYDDIALSTQPIGCH